MDKRIISTAIRYLVVAGIIVGVSNRSSKKLCDMAEDLGYARGWNDGQRFAREEFEKNCVCSCEVEK